MTLSAGRLSLSLSALLAAEPVLDRVAQAVAAGYRDLESWWPWAAEVPTPADRDAFAGRFRDHGARLLLLNLTEGPPALGRRGLAGVPGAYAAFWANAEAAIDLGSRAGTRYLNVLAGNRQPEGAARGLEVLEERLAALADRAAPAGIELVVEQLNPFDHPDYLLVDPGAAAALVRRASARTSGRIGMLADVYHLARAGVDPAAFIGENLASISHVQVADHPGRGRPGSGGIAFDRVLETLDARGYDGMVGIEYLPGGAAELGLPGPDELWLALTRATA